MKAKGINFVSEIPPANAWSEYGIAKSGEVDNLREVLLRLHFWANCNDPIEKLDLTKAQIKSAGVNFISEIKPFSPGVIKLLKLKFGGTNDILMLALVKSSLWRNTPKESNASNTTVAPTAET